MSIQRLAAGTLVFLAAIAASSRVSAEPAEPVVYNAVEHFSSNSNPNGPWSYRFTRSLAAAGEISGQYELLETPNPLGNDVGWGKLVREDQATSFFQLTDGKGGQYWVPAERDHLALLTSTLPDDGNHWQSPVLAWTAPADGLVEVNYTVKNISAVHPVDVALDKFSSGSLDSLHSLSPLQPGETATLKFTGVEVKSGDQIQLYRNGYVNQMGPILVDSNSTLTFSPRKSAGPSTNNHP